MYIRFTLIGFFCSDLQPEDPDFDWKAHWVETVRNKKLDPIVITPPPHEVNKTFKIYPLIFSWKALLDIKLMF